MGNLIFIALHFIAFLFGWVMLIVTIPAHLIYLAVSGRKTESVANTLGPTPKTHVKCPDCKELILIGARVCKHCGCKISVESEPVGPSKCPACKIDILGNKAVCSNCGIVLRE